MGFRGNRNEVTGRIVPRRRSRDLGAVLLFCILLPYVIATLTGNVKIDGKLDIEDEIMVIYESDNGVEKIPLETYMVGALAASIPEDFESETIKAQAVLLRTNILRMYQDGEYKGKNEIELKSTGQEYLTVNQMKRKWEGEFGQNYKRLQTLNALVKGEKLCYQGILITAPYFYCSAGSTRSGNEVLGSDDFPYLQPAACRTDLSVEDCGYVITYPEKEFFERVEVLSKSAADKADFWDKLELTRDGAGYVDTVSMDGRQFTGEAFRRALGLRSACFEIKQQGDRVKIETRGLGHGLGMSQCYANHMAEQGADYKEILNYFFSGVELVKE